MCILPFLRLSCIYHSVTLKCLQHIHQLLLSGSYNWNKTIPKQIQNKTKTICFGFVSALRACETKLWHKTKVSQSLLRSATLISRQLYIIMQLLTSTHHVYNNNSFVVNAGMDVRDTKFSDLVILTYLVASKKSIKMFYYYKYCTLQQKFRAV